MTAAPGADSAAGSRIDQFNQAVRGLVTLILTGGLVYGFVFSNKISSEVYSTIIASVIAYWFASREAKARYTSPPENPTQGGTS